jgi:hypothetical protein
MNTNYVFYSDPGHGWLAVSTEELELLGIDSKITAYSYQSPDGSVSYLEEDCDLATFFHAKGWNTWPEDKITSVYLKDEAFIRRLPSFVCEAYV